MRRQVRFKSFKINAQRWHFIIVAAASQNISEPWMEPFGSIILKQEQKDAFGYGERFGIRKHYDECYLIMKDVDVSELKLQKEEVIDAKYFSKRELLERIDNNYDELTEKTVSWHFLKKILDSNLNFFI